MIIFSEKHTINGKKTNHNQIKDKMKFIQKYYNDGHPLLYSIQKWQEVYDSLWFFSWVLAERKCSYECQTNPWYKSIWITVLFSLKLEWICPNHHVMVTFEQKSMEENMPKHHVVFQPHHLHYYFLEQKALSICTIAEESTENNKFNGFKNDCEKRSSNNTKQHMNIEDWTSIKLKCITITASRLEAVDPYHPSPRRRLP